LRNEEVGRIAGVFLFAVEFLPVVPDETIGDEEEERVEVGIVHYRVHRCRETGEAGHVQIKGVTGENFIDKDRDKKARIKSCFIAV